MANPSATFAHTGRGYYNWSTNQRSAIDDNYTNFVEQDDPSNLLSTFLMHKQKSKEVDSGKEFYAWAGELTPRNTTITATAAIAATASTGTITVASSAGIRKYDILWFPTSNALGNRVRVSAISGLDLTVQNIAGVTIDNASGSAVFILHEATDELESTSAEDTYMAPAKVVNRIQTLRRAWALSVTEMATATRLGVSFAQYKADQARQDFTKDVAHVFWFSASYVYGTTVVTSNGINEQLVGNSATYKINVGGNISISDWSDAMAALAPFAKNREFMVFHGEELMAGHADLGTAATIGNLKPGDSKYGFKGRSVCTNDFIFNLAYERVLSEVGAPFNAYGFILDLDAIQCYHLRGLKFKYQANIHADPGGQIRKSQYEAHVGLGLTWPKRCAYMYGITST